MRNERFLLHDPEQAVQVAGALLAGLPPFVFAHRPARRSRRACVSRVLGPTSWNTHRVISFPSGLGVVRTLVSAGCGPSRPRTRGTAPWPSWCRLENALSIAPCAQSRPRPTGGRAKEPGTRKRRLPMRSRMWSSAVGAGYILRRPTTAPQRGDRSSTSRRVADPLGVRVLADDLVHHGEEARVSFDFRGDFRSRNAEPLLEVFFVPDQHIDVFHHTVHHLVFCWPPQMFQSFSPKVQAPNRRPPARSACIASTISSPVVAESDAKMPLLLWNQRTPALKRPFQSKSPVSAGWPLRSNGCRTPPAPASCYRSLYSGHIAVYTCRA